METVWIEKWFCRISVWNWY